MVQVEESVGGEREQPSPPPKWTIMVYLAGDNSLSPNSIAIMQELEAAVQTEEICVLACFDSNTPRPKGSRYLEIKRQRNNVNNGMDWGLHNDLVSPEERGSGHPVFAPDFCNPHPALVKPVKEPTATQGLDRFLTWALRKHQAENYMLILFGHGTAVAGNTFLTDSNPPSFLRLKEFSDLLAKHFAKEKLDILACDNCVMNGIETAFEVKDRVDFMLGSQSLMLTLGWPFKKIIEAVQKDPGAKPADVALEVLKACARNLLDFSLMDRSSEQALCDLTQMRGEENIIVAIRELADELQKGLKWDEQGQVLFPEIRGAVRLARLEAQSYWDETFVDIYDFCELLLQKCMEYVGSQARLLEILGLGEADDAAMEQLSVLETIPLFKAIALNCLALLHEVERVVSASYYIGSELQYSHGLSIYFPWTLPEEPYFFEPVSDANRDYWIRTAFDEYETYRFATDAAANWGNFLRTFFKATLRDVRRDDKTYKRTSEFTFFDFEFKDKERSLPVNLLKSGTESSKEGDGCTCPKIKNYPRRHYLSPADCLRRAVPGAPADERGVARAAVSDEDSVSYLGWTVKGLVADVIKPSQPGRGSSALSPAPEESAPDKT